MKIPKTSLCLENNNINCIPKSDKIQYVGARALFDPNFIPPIIIERKKKGEILHGIITDAIEDHYSTNINLYGLEGIGKNLLVNNFLQDISLNQGDTSKKGKSSSKKLNQNVFILRVDCSDKEIEQVFFTILSQLSSIIKLQLDFNEILKLSQVKLWTSLKLILDRLKHPVILFLQKSENVSPFYLTKLYKYAKNSNKIQIITTINTGLQKYSFKQYQGMDHRIQMGLYDLKNLRQITADRSIMAFEKALEQDSINLIVDYISEYDMMVPGACMNLLKEFYPVIHQSGNLTPEILRRTTQYYFDSYNLDAITFADFVMSSSIEDRLFLEYLVDFFRSKNNFYIPFKNIKQAYSMTCEELGYDILEQEFFSSLRKITNSQVFCPSKIFQRVGIKENNGVYCVPHFLTLPVNEVNELLNVSFGMEDNLNNFNNITRGKETF
ncbi:hypothetical protein DSAG12_02064 [Promethearchaeum syntrophicum]|uniref:Uncharacterized protein n=1 Tax=Promethearchaeum syntrophicum TaxID=2594042 RepID=A0A5B9DAS6_9ARCH|nr:hypothetical protein [Candidatus Prometheoarchaeum syntrophicum]QEE16234.1 cell division control protein 6 [Candidatus Prometheoarchaeum syntrophicum]